MNVHHELILKLIFIVGIRERNVAPFEYSNFQKIVNPLKFYYEVYRKI